MVRALEKKLVKVESAEVVCGESRLCEFLKTKRGVLKVEYEAVKWDGPRLVIHMKRYFRITMKVRRVELWMHQLTIIEDTSSKRSLS